MITRIYATPAVKGLTIFYSFIVWIDFRRQINQIKHVENNYIVALEVSFHQTGLSPLYFFVHFLSDLTSIERWIDPCNGRLTFWRAVGGTLVVLFQIQFQLFCFQKVLLDPHMSSPSCLDVSCILGQGPWRTG